MSTALLPIMGAVFIAFERAASRYGSGWYGYNTRLYAVTFAALLAALPMRSQI
jgi:hypothetical protein